MLAFPHSHLFVGPKLTVVISGPHIQVLNSSTGYIYHSTRLHNNLKDAASKSGPIHCAAIDEEGKYLLTCSEDKVLKLWEIESLILLNQRELPKRPTALRFTLDAQTIIVSDKFGDVFSYPFRYRAPPPRTADAAGKQHNQRDSLLSHENPSNGKLVLGHTSLLLAFLTTPDERYIITADRDEHIRVSWFPQGYNIETYCLGHTKFVSAIHIPSFAPTELISGGGDPVLKVWDWKSGRLKCEIRVWDAVEPFIVVLGGRVRRGWSGGGQSEVRKGKGKKSKAKATSKGQGEGEGVEVGGEAEKDGRAIPSSIETEQRQEESGEKVLVVHKIQTCASGSARYIIVSAIGSTALLIGNYPDTDRSAFRAFDMKKPIIDFGVSDDKMIWVLLDGNWSRRPEDREPIKSTKFVRLFDLSSGDPVEETTESRLLEVLNTNCLLEATPDDIRKLELYNDLVNMPKSSADAEDQNQGDDSALDGKDEKNVSKRIQGRMRNKQAVQQRLKSSGETSGTALEAEERGAKKTKSVHDGSENDDVI